MLRGEGTDGHGKAQQLAPVTLHLPLLIRALLERLGVERDEERMAYLALDRRGPWPQLPPHVCVLMEYVDQPHMGELGEILRA